MFQGLMGGGVEWVASNPPLFGPCIQYYRRWYVIASQAATVPYHSLVLTATHLEKFLFDVLYMYMHVVKILHSSKGRQMAQSMLLAPSPFPM